MDKNQINFETSGPIGKDSMEIFHQMQKTDLGWFGKVFGNEKNAPTSICGMLIMLLIIFNFLLFFLDKQIALESFKSIALPLITCSLGYLFGKNK